jgi:hypothetical protein
VFPAGTWPSPLTPSAQLNLALVGYALG